MATRYGLFTKLSAEEVLRRAEKFFCPGGGVTITVAQQGNLTEVDLVAREWESQVLAFMRRLPKATPR
ncbi:MAG: hypothetical protein HY335_09900 [Deinococcus sp.]|nr:hypothetical protein [Deinococcus sp.]